jgi:hypothetical protein
MMTYSQSTGELRDAGGELLGIGYSGNGGGMNNPDMQAVKDVGPIPRGLWLIEDPFDDPGGKGPLVFRLEPTPTTDVCGRSGFLIHGDNAALDHSASEGCIVLARVIRDRISQSPDRDLTVVA